VASCLVETSGSHDINEVNIVLSALDFSNSLKPLTNTASLASSEMHAANSGCFRSNARISPNLRKPHMASKGVSAMAISGLWLESRKAEGFVLCSLAAASMLGWTCSCRGCPIDNTLVRKGKEGPKWSSSSSPSTSGCSCR